MINHRLLPHKVVKKDSHYNDNDSQTHANYKIMHKRY